MLGTVLVTAAVAGGYLLYASSVDRVVREQVAVAAPGGNVAVAAGAFASAGHETTGTATLLRLAQGGTVLTLTDLDTDPGARPPRLPRDGGAGELGDVVDLGALKGNRGDQQYDVPASVDTGRHRTVVIWCRAFSVAFGSARLA